MKYFFKTISVLGMVIGMATASVSYAQIQNPFKIGIEKGTNKAVVSAISSVGNITGNITISKATGNPLMLCPAVFNSSGVATPCSVGGLVQNEVYYVIVQAYDNNGTAYRGTRNFTLGTTETPPVVVTPTPPTSPTTPTPTTPTPTTPTPPVVVPPTSNPTPTSPSIPAPTVNPNPVKADPAAVAADKQGNGLVPCSDTCDFKDVLQLINNVISFMITVLFIPILIIMFMYAGFKYITAQGNPAKRANLKKMLMHVVVGMIVILCSWLIVKTVLNILLADPTGTFLE